jgi:hypothetical protein
MLARMERRIAELLVTGDTEAIEHSVASYRGIWLFVNNMTTTLDNTVDKSVT